MNIPTEAERYYEHLPHPYLKMIDGIIYYFYGDWQRFYDQPKALGFWTVAKILPVYVSDQDLTKLDVTFGELDRDTQLRLVSHVLDGGDVEEHIVNDLWYIQINDERGSLSFIPSSKYRALETIKNANQN